MLLQIPDVLSAAEVQQVRCLLADAAWADGRNSAGPLAAQIKNNQQLPRDSDADRVISSLILGKVERHPLFLTAALPKKIFTPRVNRYGGNTPSYGAHIDNAICAATDGRRVRTDVSCTVFLSDPDEYEGGELLVEDTYGSRGVKLPAGHAVLYPGTSIHRVTPVTRGHRVASFFWIESMVRSDEQRRLLFDLDMSVMRLREKHGDDEEAMALTGTYHNLLRMWADT